MAKTPIAAMPAKRERMLVSPPYEAMRHETPEPQGSFSYMASRTA
jgi:hypothetical protein